jgi:predicted metal-dependent hydrolase
MKATRRKRLKTADQLKAAVKSWAAKIKSRPKQIRIQRMERKWASCSSHGRITFSSDLFDQPYGFQEFVIVHELLHLNLSNHGRLFKSLLKAHLSNSRFRRCGRVARGLSLQSGHCRLDVCADRSMGEFHRPGCSCKRAAALRR